MDIDLMKYSTRRVAVIGLLIRYKIEFKER